MPMCHFWCLNVAWQTVVAQSSLIQVTSWNKHAWTSEGMLKITLKLIEMYDVSCNHSVSFIVINIVNNWLSLSAKKYSIGVSLLFTTLAIQENTPALSCYCSTCPF